MRDTLWLRRELVELMNILNL